MREFIEDTCKECPLLAVLNCNDQELGTRCRRRSKATLEVPSSVGEGWRRSVLNRRDPQAEVTLRDIDIEIG